MTRQAIGRVKLPAWLRMPVGISSAPEVFQRKLMQALKGIPGIYIIVDDALITGEGATQEDAWETQRQS